MGLIFKRWATALAFLFLPVLGYAAAGTSTQEITPGSSQILLIRHEIKELQAEELAYQASIKSMTEQVSILEKNARLIDKQVGMPDRPQPQLFGTPTPSAVHHKVAVHEVPATSGRARHAVTRKKMTNQPSRIRQTVSHHPHSWFNSTFMLFAGLLSAALTATAIAVVYALKKRNNAKIDLSIEQIMQVGATTPDQTPQQEDTQQEDTGNEQQKTDVNDGIFEWVNSDIHTHDTDPVAEADVYLSYDRYESAKNVLEGVLEENPDREDAVLKMLEVYVRLNDLDAFDELVTKWFARGSREMWEAISQMGKDIDPGNPLYGSVDGENTVRSAQKDAREEALDIDGSFLEFLQETRTDNTNKSYKQDNDTELTLGLPKVHREDIFSGCDIPLLPE